MKVLHAKDFVLSKLERGYYTFPLREAEGAIGTGEKTWKVLGRSSPASRRDKSE